MGKFELFLLLLGIGALVIFSQAPSTPSTPSAPTTSTAILHPSSALPPTVGAPSGEINGFPIVASFTADNFKIVDGDSIRLQTAQSGEVDLRLASVDAPEWTQTAGRAAKKHLEGLTSGRAATFYQTDTDRYKRPVVFMFVGVSGADGRTVRPLEVNAQMVADGFAWHAHKYSSSTKLQQLQQQAKAARVGLWADANPIPPWEFRDRK